MRELVEGRWAVRLDGLWTAAPAGFVGAGADCSGETGVATASARSAASTTAPQVTAESAQPASAAATICAVRLIFASASTRVISLRSSGIHEKTRQSQNADRNNNMVENAENPRSNHGQAEDYRKAEKVSSRFCQAFADLCLPIRKLDRVFATLSQP